MTTRRISSMNEGLKTMIGKRVDVALSHRFRCELSDSKTGKPVSPQERRRTLTVLFGEIAKGMGVERFAETPVERLDQFAVMSLVNNHDTAGLLRSLVNSFMIAYADPDTSNQAFQALLQIEALRAKVADSRGQSSNLMQKKYWTSLRSASARSISWGITFDQWMDLWKKSDGWDHLKDKPKKHFCLSRKNTNIGFEINNVEIIKLGSHMKKISDETEARINVIPVDRIKPKTGAKVYTSEPLGKTN